jgi:regulator of sirC expression with transglutaminase-like and TPR domain
MSRAQAEKKVNQITGRAAQDKDFEPVTKKAILVRMLHNLINVAESEKDGVAILRYLDGILAVDQDAHEERWARAVFRFQARQRGGALEDCESLIQSDPPGVDLDRVRELRRLLQGKK